MVFLITTSQSRMSYLDRSNGGPVFCTWPQGESLLHGNAGPS